MTGEGGAAFPDSSSETDIGKKSHGNLDNYCSLGGGMAHSHSLKSILFGIFLCLFSILAQAEKVPSIPTVDLPVQYTSASTPGSWYPYSGMEGHCKTFIANYATQTGLPVGYHSMFANGSTYLCMHEWTTNPGVSVKSLVDYSLGCPAGKMTDLGGKNYICRINTPSCPDSSWTLSTDHTYCERANCQEGEERQPDGTCKKEKICPPGTEKDDKGECINSCMKLKGTSMDAGWMKTTGRGLNICMGGCEMSAGTCIAARSIATGEWVRECKGPLTITGNNCTATDGGGGEPEPLKEEDPRTKCARQGLAYGEVNGTIICVKADETTTDTSSSENKESNTTDKDGNKTGGSKEGTDTNTKTTCVGDECTTETTRKKTDADGNTSEEKTIKKEDRSDFCKDNPKHAACVTGSFSGSCGGAPACDGDAVQCAQALAAWKIQCNMEKEPEDAAYKLGKSITEGGNDPAGNPLSEDKTNKIDVASIVSQAAGQRTLSASCIPSPSFSALGRTYTLNTDYLCKFAEAVGYLLVALSSVIAIRMVAA